MNNFFYSFQTYLFNFHTRIQVITAGNRTHGKFKTRALNVISKMPDTAKMDDIMYRL